MDQQGFSEKLDFIRLDFSLNHDLTFFVWIHFVVFVIGNFLEHESVSWSEAYIDRIVSKGVGNKLIVKFSSENLNNTANHFSDLVVEEGLSFQEEMDKLDRIWIFRVTNFKRVLVDVHKVVTGQFHHESLGRHLVGFNVLRVVVVFLGAKEDIEELLHSVFALLGKSGGVQLLNLTRCYVVDVPR